MDEPNGVGFRLRAMAHVPLAVGLAGTASAKIGRLGRGIVSVLGLAAVLADAPRGERPADELPGVVVTPPARRDAMARLIDKLAADARVASPSRRLMFLYTWTSRRPARRRVRPQSRDDEHVYVLYGPGMSRRMRRVVRSLVADPPPGTPHSVIVRLPNASLGLAAIPVVALRSGLRG